MIPGSTATPSKQAKLPPPVLVTPMECHLKFPIAQGNSWDMATKVGKQHFDRQPDD